MNPRISESEKVSAHLDAELQYETIKSVLERALERRGWSQSDLAAVLGWSAQFLSDVINRRTRIGPDDALDLSCALGTAPEDWLRLQSENELRVARTSPHSSDRLRAIEIRREIEELLPTREMIRRGTLPNGDAEHLAKATLELLGVDSINEIDSLPAVARRSASTGPHPKRSQLAWLAEARSMHLGNLPPATDLEAILALGSSLSTTVLTHEDMKRLPWRFASVGIALKYVPPYGSAKIDGACTIVEGSPLIAIAGRGNRWDKIMFTIAHELAHVALGHLNSTTLFVTDSSEELSGDIDIRESQADLCAGHWLLPNFEEIRHRILTEAAIEQFALANRVPIALVIGRLQREGLLPWNSRLNKRIESVKEDIKTWI